MAIRGRILRCCCALAKVPYQVNVAFQRYACFLMATLVSRPYFAVATLLINVASTVASAVLVMQPPPRGIVRKSIARYFPEVAR